MEPWSVFLWAPMLKEKHTNSQTVAIYCQFVPNLYLHFSTFSSLFLMYSLPSALWWSLHFRFSPFLHFSLWRNMIDSIYLSYLSTLSFVPFFHLSCYPFMIPFISTSIFPAILLASCLLSIPPSISFSLFPPSLLSSPHRAPFLHRESACPPRVIPLEG